MEENKRLAVRDLVGIGIFSAIYMVVSMILMIPAGFSPYIWLLWPALAGLGCGTIITLLLMRTQKAGVAFLLSAIVGLLFFATGECTWMIVATMVFLGLVAEAGRKYFGYNSTSGIAFSGGAVAVGLIGSPLPMWLFQESYTKSLAEMGMATEYIEQMKTISSTSALIMMIALAFCGGLLGSVIGSQFLKKHFEKAGII